MKVWIDQDLCTGDGLCEEIAPDVFTLLDDGLAYVKEGAKVFSDPGGPEGLANVPAGMEEATIESAEECPGEGIFIEVEGRDCSRSGEGAPSRRRVLLPRARGAFGSGPLGPRLAEGPSRAFR